MESVKRDKYTSSGTVVSEWNSTAAATVPACAPRCPTSFVLPTAANTTGSKPGPATEHTVRRKWERAGKWHADNWQWWEWGGSRGARTGCFFCTRTRAANSCPAGAHVRCRPLGLTRFTCDDQECRSGSGITLSWDGPRDDGTGYAAARVCSARFLSLSLLRADTSSQ